MNPYTSLAKKAVEIYIREGKTISSSEEETRKAGVFVTIMKNKNLRGCIGTYLPTKENIAEEIISNVIAAATKDNRFDPVQEEELPHLTYSVYILNEPEVIKEIQELDPKKYGIIIKTETGKSGLLLPGLEGINTTEKQITATCQKAGIDPIIEPLIIYKFTVEKHEGE